MTKTLQSTKFYNQGGDLSQMNKREDTGWKFFCLTFELKKNQNILRPFYKILDQEKEINLITLINSFNYIKEKHAAVIVLPLLKTNLFFINNKG